MEEYQKCPHCFNDEFKEKMIIDEEDGTEDVILYCSECDEELIFEEEE